MHATNPHTNMRWSRARAANVGTVSAGIRPTTSAMLKSRPALLLLAPWLWNTLGSQASVA